MLHADHPPQPAGRLRRRRADARCPRLSRAQAADTIRIGVLNDLSGPLPRHRRPDGGRCAKQAVAGIRRHEGFKVEVISRRPPEQARCRRRTSPGSGIDRDGVDMILDVPTSSVGLAVNEVAREKNKVYINCRRRHLGPDRLAVHAEYHPLDVRHLHAGQVAPAARW